MGRCASFSDHHYLGRVAKLPSEPGVPYSILVFSGMLIWTFFAQCFTGISSSLLANGNLISKVYIPRLIIPVSSIAVTFVDFLLTLFFFALLLVWFQFLPPIQCLLLPFFVLLAGALALGPGLAFAAWSLPYRDIVHIAPLIAQLGMYVSPVVYASSLIPEKWILLYSLNPMVGVVDGFRWALLGVPDFPHVSILISVLWAVVLLALGLSMFRRMERTFVDVLQLVDP